MPRSNPHRTINAERHLASRIITERDARGWTNESLARRMTEAGCPIRDSAIYKIEHGDPPRRITVDELAAFASVFELPVALLVTDPEFSTLPKQAIDAVLNLEYEFRGHEKLTAELRRIEEKRADLHNEIVETIEGDRVAWDAFREWIATNWDNWPAFLHWSQIDRLLKNSSTSRRGK